MATSKKAAKPALKKPTSLERVTTTSGIITYFAEAELEFIKGEFVSISSDPHKIVQQAAKLADLGRFDEAREQADRVPEKSYVGLNKLVEQRVVRNAIRNYVESAEDRYHQFGVLGFVKPTDGTRFGRSPG